MPELVAPGTEGFNCSRALGFRQGIEKWYPGTKMGSEAAPGWGCHYGCRV